MITRSPSRVRRESVREISCRISGAIDGGISGGVRTMCGTVFTVLDYSYGVVGAYSLYTVRALYIDSE